MLLPKDYVRFRMTGSFATDMSDGSGALLLDCAHRAWSPEIAAACGIPLSLLPPVLEGSSASGQLSGAVAKAWGLTPGIVVAAGAGDARGGRHCHRSRQRRRCLHLDRHGVAIFRDARSLSRRHPNI